MKAYHIVRYRQVVEWRSQGIFPLHRRIQGSAPGAVTVTADIALAALDGTFKFALHYSV